MARQSLTGGPSGNVQQVTLMGPYPVTFETPDITTDPGALLDTIPADAVILRAWAESTEGWSGGAGDFLAVNVCTAADPSGTYYSVRFYDFGDGAGADNANLGFEINATMNTSSDATPVRLKNELQLRVGIWIASPPFTIGASDIYALIATPA